MNPVPLLLVLMATNGNRQPFNNSSAPLKLDTVLDQLQSTVNTLEKVNQLSRMGKTPSNSFSLPAPVEAPRPVESFDQVNYQNQQSAPSLPNIDLQSAMQSLGPILSMLGNNK